MIPPARATFLIGSIRRLCPADGRGTARSAVAGTAADMAISSWCGVAWCGVVWLVRVRAGDGDDGQPEVAELAQHAVQRRLVDDEAGEHRGAVGGMGQ